VLPQAVGRWLEIGFALGPVAGSDAGVWWMPSARRGLGGVKK